MLAAPNPQPPPLLTCAKHLVLPLYPKLAKIAHDARTVIAKVKPSGNALAVVELTGGNKYYNEAIRNALSAWSLSPDRPIAETAFVITFDFKLTEDPNKDGLCEVDVDESKVVVWGLMRYTDIEQLPIATK